MNRPLSKIRKKPAQHMWFITKVPLKGWIITIGDPHDRKSKLVASFSNKEDLKYWVKYTMAETVSADHVIDNSGLKLVSPYYTQWYVDNILHA